MQGLDLGSVSDFLRFLRRNSLFGTSGIRGNYPQFFFEFADGSVHFIGRWETIEMINDSSGLPEEILDMNPEIQTWDQMFGGLALGFD